MYYKWKIGEARIFKKYDFLRAPKPVLGPTQLPIEWVPGHSRVVKRPGRGVDHPPTSISEVKERVELYIYSSLCAFMADYRATFTFVTRQFVALHLRLQLLNRLVCPSFSNVPVYNADSAVLRNVGTDLIYEAAQSRKLS